MNQQTRQPSRRSFLADMGMGFSGLVLGSMLAEDGFVNASSPSPATAVKPARAKSVIWIFNVGGVSQMESFDPKPALNQYAGKSIAETPYKDVLTNKLNTENVRIPIPNDANGHIWPKIFPLQVGYKKRGKSGIEISDWWPHLGDCVDDMAIVRSLWTTDNNHGAQLQFHTAKHSLEGPFPTIGSWVSYGLGTLNENLPRFVVLGKPLADCCGGMGGHGAHYLGPEYDGVQLALDAKEPMPYVRRPAGVSAKQQIAEFELAKQLNGLAAVEYPDDPALRARIKSYELAFGMQTAVPEVVTVTGETVATQNLYGLDNPATQEFGRVCLTARRLVERGVRFVQIFHGSNGGAGAWDAHGALKSNHSKLCGATDKPIAGLLKDLKARGLLDETIVVWGTEFGRTPGAQNSDGRDHHPYGFSAWLAGGGVKGGVTHGKTDELGFHAVENRHYIADIHATVLTQLGIDPQSLQIPGRKRLAMEIGQPIGHII